MRSEDQALIEGTIITPKVILITLEEIGLLLDVTHVMRNVTYPNTALMFMLQRMMNLPKRESDKKVILQVMNNMC